MFKRFFQLVISLSIILTFLFLGYWLYNHKFFQIKTLSFSPMNQSHAFLYQKIKDNQFSHIEKAVVGQKIWDIPISKIVSELKKDENVNLVQVKRVLPSKIVIKVKPYSPIAMIVTEKSQFYPVSVNGIVLPKVKAGETMDLPIFRGVSIDKSKQIVRRLARFVASLPEDKGFFNKKNISEIIYKKEDGLVVTLNSDSFQIKIWDEALDDKIAQINQVILYLKNKKIQSRVIDARFNKKIVVKLRNES